MINVTRLFLMIGLSFFSAVIAEETAMFQSAVPDHSGVEIMGIPANWVEMSYALNNGSIDAAAQKAMARTRILEALLRAFSSERFPFTPDFGYIARVSPGPELLAYQEEVSPVQQGANPEDAQNLFAIMTTEYAIIPAQYAVDERVEYSRIQARLSDRKRVIRMVS